MFIAYPSVNSNWSYSPKTPRSGRNWQLCIPSDIEICQTTLKNNKAPLICHIKLYASCHRHMWIQTGFTVRKWLHWILTWVILTFDLWPWPFSWTSLMPIVITPENVMMIRLEEHCRRGVTDRRTWKGRTDWAIHRAWSQLGVILPLRFYAIVLLRRLPNSKRYDGVTKSHMFKILRELISHLIWKFASGSLCFSRNNPKSIRL